MLKRSAQVFVVIIAAFTMLGAGSPANRFDRLGHQLMCTCGCSEILLECNHMGCPDSPGLISALHAQLDSGVADTGVLHWFADKYGPTVLAAPIRGGFDLVAWIMPFLILALGLVGIFWLLRHWRDRHASSLLTHPPLQPGAGTPAEALRERIRRETTYDS